MFNLIIKRILRLIHLQLNRGGFISDIYLVRSFSESKYLQERICEEFLEKVKNIFVPPQPMAAVVREGNYKN